MSLSLGNAIAVSTNFIKSNPAVPVYNGEECPSNLYAVIYHHLYLFLYLILLTLCSPLYLILNFIILIIFTTKKYT